MGECQMEWATAEPIHQATARGALDELFSSFIRLFL